MSRQSPKLLGLLRRFAGATDGNVALIFGIVVVPLIAFVGAAVDYSRANMARSAMQAALDSASLMVSKDLSAGTITTAQVSAKAQAYFTALYTNKEASGITITSNYTVGSGTTGSTVQINASGSIATDFMKVVGFPNMGFSASSTATWGTQLLRVALVLDNTGSMANSGKIGALQSAAKSLVSQLSALAKNNGDVYISVVPFEVDVNVGTTNSGASWLRWDLYDSTLYDSRGNTYCSSGNALSYSTLAECKGHGST
jgi:Flp pilus assembly protein TadG